MKRKIVIEGFEFALRRCDIEQDYIPLGYGRKGLPGDATITLELEAHRGDTSKEDWARLMEVIRVGKAMVLFE